jgi:hypothetical protein
LRVGSASLTAPVTHRQRSHSSRYGFRQPYLGWERSCGGLPTALGSLSPHPIPLCMGKGPSRTLLCPHARGARAQRIMTGDADEGVLGARERQRRTPKRRSQPPQRSQITLWSRFSSRFRRTVGVACASLAGRRTLGRCAWFWVIRRHPAAYLQRRLAPHHRAKHKGACCGRCSHGLSPGQAVPFQHKAHLPASTLGIFLDVHHLRIRP